MITEQLIHPKSIVVVGASNDTSKAGGKILKNLIDHHFQGELYVINPKTEVVQGIRSYSKPEELPETDLAILAVPAALCPGIAGILARQKNTRAFITISAGFSEENKQGARYEEQLVQIAEQTGSSLIGPNCIGVITTTYAGCFTTPIPVLNPKGVDLISGSGATAVYIMESAIPNGLTFSSVFSVGNSAQLGVEDILEYLDESFDPATSSLTKLLYFESIQKPEKLLKHAASLVRKGCRIAAIKAGTSKAGARAASSHTGAMATADQAVEALFRKAGIVRCYSRYELAALGGLFSYPAMKGNRMAIITHAGGPAVMLTDVLSNGGIEVPHLEGAAVNRLLTRLHPGSSVANPIDVLATGTEEHLAACIDCVEKELDEIDGMCVIFGSPGLFSMDSVYSLLHERIRSCTKPIYPLLPSTINAADEVQRFLSKGNVNFPDEVIFGQALVRASQVHGPWPAEGLPEGMNEKEITRIVDESEAGYLSPDRIRQLLDAAGIDRIEERMVSRQDEAVQAAGDLGYPVAMKAVGPLHKTDIGGVVLQVKNAETVAHEFNRLMLIENTTGVLIQPMAEGVELFIGAHYEPGFGQMVFFGLGGILVEVMKDVQSGLAPLTRAEVSDGLNRLKGKKILEGVRGSQGVDISRFTDSIIRVSHLVYLTPEIKELDLNPLISTGHRIMVVDARIRLEK